MTWNRWLSRDLGRKQKTCCIWALILREALVKLQGSFANEELDVEGRCHPWVWGPQIRHCNTSSKNIIFLWNVQVCQQVEGHAIFVFGFPFHGHESNWTSKYGMCRYESQMCTEFCWKLFCVFTVTQVQVVIKRRCETACNFGMCTPWQYLCRLKYAEL
jgi:hypothetical protein